MLLIELAILDVLLILTAFVCFKYVSNRNARVGAGAGILALGIAVTTTFPFFPVIGIGIGVSLIGLWILSLRPPKSQVQASDDADTQADTQDVDVQNMPSDVQSDDASDIQADMPTEHHSDTAHDGDVSNVSP